MSIVALGLPISAATLNIVRADQQIVTGSCYYRQLASRGMDAANLASKAMPLRPNFLSLAFALFAPKAALIHAPQTRARGLF
jgi:hypothetical protein